MLSDIFIQKNVAYAQKRRADVAVFFYFFKVVPRAVNWNCEADVLRAENYCGVNAYGLAVQIY